MTPKACAVARLLNAGRDGATMKGGALGAFSLNAHSRLSTIAECTHHPKYFPSKVSFKPCNHLKHRHYFPC